MQNELDLERTRYFMPYIRRFLFPEAEPSKASASACKRYQLDFERTGLPREGTLSGFDNQDGHPFQAPFEFKRIELMLFGYNIGFLVIELKCLSEMTTFADQMILAGLFRMLAPYVVGQKLPVLTLDGKSLNVPQLVSNLLSEAGGRTPGVLATTPAQVAEFPVSLFYDDRMMTYCFSCLSGKLPTSDLIQLDRGMRKQTIIPFDDDSVQKSQIAREQGDEQWLQCRWQGFTKEGGVLVAFDNEEFNRIHLPNYFTTYYFDVFIFATLQRAALLNLNERLSDIPNLTEDTWSSRKVLRKLRHDILLFRNQCCFSQVTLRERGLQLWRKWMSAYDNETLMTEVDHQSKELESYFQSVSRERMEWVARIGGFLAAVVPGILGMNVVLGDEPWVTNLKVILISTVSVACGIFALYILVRKPSAEHRT